MKVVGVYNMKGGVGKTTTAVNLSYLAARSGLRTLLWDSDPQAASSFAFRVRARVDGFRGKYLEESLSGAIKETDYKNLDILPADFAYRKFDRVLDHLGKPERVMTSLLAALGRDYDLVLLDCPAGFSLLTEGIFAAASAVLVPTIPTVLSLRMVARLVKWAERSNSPAMLSAFWSMVDRRKTLHRQACDWSKPLQDIFMTGEVPYASVVEQMAVRRLPLAMFAPREAAAAASAQIWAELQVRLQQQSAPGRRQRWVRILAEVEELTARLESTGHISTEGSALSAVDAREGDGPPNRDAVQPQTGGGGDVKTKSAGNGHHTADSVCIVHSFDTEQGDLQTGGHVLQLRERNGRLTVVAASALGAQGADVTGQIQATIDSSWALQILSGEMSPLAALEQRLGRPKPPLVEGVRTMTGGRALRRIDSRIDNQRTADGADGLYSASPVRSGPTSDRRATERIAG